MRFEPIEPTNNCVSIACLRLLAKRQCCKPRGISVARTVGIIGCTIECTIEPLPIPHRGERPTPIGILGLQKVVPDRPTRCVRQQPRRSRRTPEQDCALMQVRWHIVPQKVDQPINAFTSQGRLLIAVVDVA